MSFDRKGYMRNYNKEYSRRNKDKKRIRGRIWAAQKSIKEHTVEEGLILGPYKMPLKKVEKGYGYYGALTFDVTGKLQCHVCGALYDHLAFHVKQHKLNTKTYKEKFKLAPMTALISEGQREVYKMQAMERFLTMTPEQKADRMKKSKAGWKKWYDSLEGAHNFSSLETKNKRGICPDQLIELIKGAQVHYGHVPSLPEFQNFYHTQRYDTPIRRTFGSWHKGIMAAGMQPKEKSSPKGLPRHRYTDDELLDLLTGFYQENGVTPSASDCRRGFLPDNGVFIRHFGSFPEARRRAGLEEWENRQHTSGKRNKNKAFGKLQAQP